MILTKLPSGKIIATIEGDTHIGKWAIESGRLDHDQNMLPLLRPFIPEGGTVIDVGAYIGDHTVFYAECVGENGTVVAMEPNPPAFECLQYNTRELSQVLPLHKGASSGDDGYISIHSNANGGAAYGTNGGDILCQTIDGLRATRCDFIKMDCEGMEPLAISGAWETIKAHKPVMLIEINQGALARQGRTPEHIFDMLNELGYTYRNIYPNQPMSGGQYDILCQPILST